MGNTPSHPSTPQSRTPSRTPRQTSDESFTPHSDRRRKKSIDLSDLEPPTLSVAGGRKGSHGRKRGTSTDLVAVDEGDEVEGTLRGAMQGRAAHVVYGPRRPDLDTVIPAGLPSTSASMPIEAVKRASTTLLRPGAPKAISIPEQASSIDAKFLAPHDPDDTLHPAYANSPRLTSHVLLTQEAMPVIISPSTEEAPDDSPFMTAPSTSRSSPTQSLKTPTGAFAGLTTSAPIAPAAVPLNTHAAGVFPSGLGKGGTQTSLAGVLATMMVPTAPVSPAGMLHQLPPPHTSPPFPPALAPTDTVHAPVVPVNALPLPADDIPSGTGVLLSAQSSPYGAGTPSTTASDSGGGSAVASGQETPITSVLLPSSLLNAPVAAIPIPLPSVPSPTIAASLMAAAVDVGAGPQGVPTLIKWKDEDGGLKDGVAGGPQKVPNEVFVTGTFARGWKTKIALRKTGGQDATDFSALISLPPGPHRLKFIVDKEWKASKHLPSATDADGNLINYLQVSGAVPADGTFPLWYSGNATDVPGASGSIPPGGAVPEPEEDSDDEDDGEWTDELPAELTEWGEWEAEREAIEAGEVDPAKHPLRPPPFAHSVMPPSLPAQLEKGPLNHAAYVTQGSGDDNSILPKPDHSVINHLAASPIKGGFLSVGVTTRYKRKFITSVYYKSMPESMTGGAKG